MDLVLTYKTSFLHYTLALPISECPKNLLYCGSQYPN